MRPRTTSAKPAPRARLFFAACAAAAACALATPAESAPRRSTTKTTSARLVAEGRLLEARQALEAAIERETRKDVVKAKTRELDALTKRIPRLRLQPVTGFHGDVLLDGRKLSARELESDLEVDPGEHEIVVRVEGAAPARQLVALDERERHVLSLEMPAVKESPKTAPLPEPTPTSTTPVTRTLAYVGFGSAALAAGIGTTLFFLAKGERDKLSERCPENRCSDAERAQFDRGKGYADGATVALAAGAILATTSVTLFLIGGKNKESGASVRVGAAPDRIFAAGRF